MKAHNIDVAVYPFFSSPSHHVISHWDLRCVCFPCCLLRSTQHPAYGHVSTNMKNIELILLALVASGKHMSKRVGWCSFSRSKAPRAMAAAGLVCNFPARLRPAVVIHETTEHSQIQISPARLSTCRIHCLSGMAGQ